MSKAKRTDTDRLNWVIENAVILNVHHNGKWYCADMFNSAPIFKDTPRQAIDAAMDAKERSK